MDAERRTREMHGLYREGATLEEAGAPFGLSKERVRQIFAQAGIPTRSTSRSIAMQREIVAAKRREEICAAFVELQDMHEVARRLKIPHKVVREVVKSSFSERELRRRRPSSPLYSDDELIAFLREAGERSGGSLSLRAYKAYAEGRRTADGRAWPTAQSFSKRLGDGSWPKAVRAAGLKSARGPRRGVKTFDEEQCIEALRAAARELGKAPTAEEYCTFAAASAGALPSLATVRNRFNTWYEALDRAGI